ncbi:hypothetical protein BC830DRAFT_1077629 [Chytriomyces sp. MP71]|nr:hypothetical protein BC830DRAFT_1077629 [Chytriomyces sp. MP71]
MFWRLRAKGHFDQSTASWFQKQDKNTRTYRESLRNWFTITKHLLEAVVSHQEKVCQEFKHCARYQKGGMDIVNNILKRKRILQDGGPKDKDFSANQVNIMKQRLYGTVLSYYNLKIDPNETRQ